MKQFVSQIDLIVFDIDGVLIDTFLSFIATIVATTKNYINDILKISVDLTYLSESNALQFKTHSGFNNDWVLTQGLIAYHLFTLISGNKEYDLSSFLLDVDREGGGLPGIMTLIEKQGGREISKWVKARIDENLINNTFKELYGGNKFCESLYGFSPQNFKGKGAVEFETVLFDSELLRDWKGGISILTGRTEKETELALKMTGLENINREMVQYSDNELPDKPNPEKLNRIIHNAGCNSALHIGDSIDDYCTVVNYNSQSPKIPVRFGLICSENDRFPEEARKLYSDSVNHLVEFIIKNNSKKTYGHPVKKKVNTCARQL